MNIEWFVKIRRSALTSIVKYRAFIHRLRFTSDIDVNTLISIKNSNIVTNFKIYRDQNIKKTYSHIATWKIGKKRFRAYLNPTITVRRSSLCLIELEKPTKNLLLTLNLLIPGLTVSLAEYTVDLYCPDHLAVEKLFFVFRRYLYYPRVKKPMIISSDRHIEWWTERKENAVYRLGALKIYERGLDKKRVGVGWRHCDVDRVRVEFTARGAQLKSLGLKRLSDFISCPKMETMFSKRIRFVHFKSSSELPGEYDDYLAEDAYGNRDSFQQEYIRAQEDKVRNPYQYMVDSEDFTKLRAEIGKALRKFDNKWCG